MNVQSTARGRPRSARAQRVKGLGRFAGAVLLFLAIVESASVTVAWSRGELEPLALADGLWIVLLPLWIALFLRYYSVLRPDCSACQAPDRDRTGMSD